MIKLLPAMSVSTFMKWLSALLSLFFLSCQDSNSHQNISQAISENVALANSTTENGKAIITLGGGCFWCTEAVFQRLKGVDTVISGYMGGHTKNPTYKEITTGRTGHAEVIRVEYDPAVISALELLEVFFATHDPTTLNRQGADVGTQYRSVIFWHTPDQKKLSEEVILELDKAKIYRDPIVTEIAPASQFYPAEDYHQNYYNLNTSQGYCSFVITPKIQKLEKVFKDKLAKP
jgi:peptide-methionine (S)-S-oxide reductase